VNAARMSACATHMNIESISSTSTLPERTAATNRSGASFQAALTQASSSDPAKIADAAKQFEALMLGQILKASRDSSDGGWLGSGDDQAGELAVDMAEQQFAQAMSAKGGLGIAKLVTTGLQRGAAKAAKSGSPASDQAPKTSTYSQ
jgi:Rod binding domain-containing protein